MKTIYFNVLFFFSLLLSVSQIQAQEVQRGDVFRENSLGFMWNFSPYNLENGFGSNLYAGEVGLYGANDWSDDGVGFGVINYVSYLSPDVDSGGDGGLNTFLALKYDFPLSPNIEISPYLGLGYFDFDLLIEENSYFYASGGVSGIARLSNRFFASADIGLSNQFFDEIFENIDPVSPVSSTVSIRYNVF